MTTRAKARAELETLGRIRDRIHTGDVTAATLVELERLTYSVDLVDNDFYEAYHETLADILDHAETHATPEMLALLRTNALIEHVIGVRVQRLDELAQLGASDAKVLEDMPDDTRPATR